MGDADYDDPPQGAVGLAVTAWVETDLTGRLAGPGRDRGYATEVRPGCFGMQALGVVAGCHHECGGGVGPDAEATEELRSGVRPALGSARQVGELILQGPIRCASDESDALVATYRIARTSRRKLDSLTTRSVAESLESAPQFLWC